MFRPLELSIGLRYTRAKRRNHFISFISFISILGVAVGVMALIVVLSVMNGFGNELRGRILGVVSHVTITEGRVGLNNWQQVSDRIKDQEHVLGNAPYIDGQGMLVQKQETQGVMVRGIHPAKEMTVSDIGKQMLLGSFDKLKSGKFGIIVGSTVAWKLNLTEGSKITLLIPQALATPAGLLPRFKQFTVVGIFEMGVHEYDSGLVLIHMNDAARLYQMSSTVSGIRLKLDDLERAQSIAQDIQRELGNEYFTYDWTRKHANFFKAIKLEKRVMLVILLLIVAVAAINIVSTLVMVVTDKQSDIAILRTLGLRPASIMGVFMVQGTIIGVIGTLVGTVCGVLLAVNVEAVVRNIENILDSKLIPADVYMIPDLPSEVYWSDVTIIASVSLFMGIIATLYPAWRAAKVQPAQALRYE